jgi:hypothetical protein
MIFQTRLYCPSGASICLLMEEAMEIDLVSLAKQYLPPPVLERIASALSVNRALIERANSAAIPALLASFAGQASYQRGARKLADAVGKDSAIGDVLTSSVNSLDLKVPIAGGLRSLNSILGSPSVSALSMVLARLSGMDQSSSYLLLGMLAALLLKVLGEQVSESDFDGQGLARLLVSQKDNIAVSMPSDFVDLVHPERLSVATSSALQADSALTQMPHYDVAQRLRPSSASAYAECVPGRGVSGGGLRRRSAGPGRISLP